MNLSYNEIAKTEGLCFASRKYIEMQ